MPNLLDRIQVRALKPTGDVRHRIVGHKLDPLISCNFLVSIENLGADFKLPPSPDRDRVGFSRISGVGVELITEDVLQGSYPVEVALPRGIRYTKATFTHGVGREAAAYALMLWFQDIRELLNTGISPDARRRSLTSDNAPTRIKKRDITIKIPWRPQGYSVSTQIRSQDSRRPYGAIPGVLPQGARPVIGRTVQVGMQPRNFADSGSTDHFELVLLRAWPIKMAFGDLNASESAVFIHQMEIMYEGIEIVNLVSK